jgi:hypothetical protein
VAHPFLRHIVLAIVLIVPAVPVQAQQAQASTQKPWWERLTFFGDFRGRYEGFFQEGVDSRQRGRYRFRFGVRTPIAEGLDFNFRLASGEAADVTSTNQSFGEFQNRKPINIDQVSLTFNPPAATALTLGVGKYAYPVIRTQMVWDDDVNWEGIFEQVGWRAGRGSFRLVGAQVTMNEVAADEDSFLFAYAGQAGFTAGRHSVQVQVADYLFHNPDQIAVALHERTEIRTQNTNALRHDAAGDVVGYVSGFNVVDTIAQATFNTGREQYPLVATADFAMNTRAATEDDQGLWLVAAYGRAATPRTYQATYTYARIEQDAVVSAFNFSDMVPATNVVMNMTTFSYMPRNRVNLDFIAILTRLLEPPPMQPNPLLTRIQIDARVTF